MNNLTRLNREDTIKHLDMYLELYPEERPALEEFYHFVLRYQNRGLCSRKNFEGHITASAIICDNEMKRFLLLYHLGLNKWLQPGGHVEEGDRDFIAASLREVFEETGISIDQMELMTNSEGFPLFDADSHRIPANPKKGEPAHWHHDLRILLRLREPVPLVVENEDESSGHRWVSSDELREIFSTDRIKLKVPDYCNPVTLP